MKNFDLTNFLEKHSPGYIIEIYNNGKTEELVYGNKSILPNIQKASKETLYDIASLTKVYTATLVYIAYEEGLIDINDTIYNLNRNFKNLKDVTILDLLSHNQNIWTDGYLGNAKNKEEFFKILYSAYVKEKTPTYVDVHYIILSTILEKVYKQDYATLCAEKIFNKLNLKNTTFTPNPDLCASNNYQHIENNTIEDIYPGLTHDTKGRIAKTFGVNLGHASIFTTGHDLLIFLESFLNNSLLKEETIKFMLKHKNINEQNLKKLKNITNGKDINQMYEDIQRKQIKVNLPKTYNNMGTRYKNAIKKLNDVPDRASDNSISFSGYTGPMFTIDFDNKVIVVIMCNVIHNSYLCRDERKEKTIEIMNMIFTHLIKDYNYDKIQQNK